MRNLMLIILTSLWILGCIETPVEPTIDDRSIKIDSIITDSIPDDSTTRDTLLEDSLQGDPTQGVEQPGVQKLKLIFDTDIAEDVDDAGAMAALHALADKGELDILAMMVSMPVDYGAPALDAINTYYNRPNIPIGTLKNSKDAAGAGNLLVYNKALATQFPNDLKHADNTPNALTLYRKLLANEPDQSVVILTVGPLTNLFHLMKSTSDEFSPLNGMELIKKKVKRFIMAGGSLPEGTSYNFRLSPDKSEYVINNWPTEHWLVPNELGGNVLTGKEMLANTTTENPIHFAYALYRKAHPGWQFRPSWDQMGVYIAARGTGDLFKTDSTGSVKAWKQFISWARTPE